MMTPTMLWTDMTMMAAGHCSDVALPPYLATRHVTRVYFVTPTLPYGVLGLQTEEEG